MKRWLSLVVCGGFIYIAAVVAACWSDWQHNPPGIPELDNRCASIGKCWAVYYASGWQQCVAVLDSTKGCDETDSKGNRLRSLTPVSTTRVPGTCWLYQPFVWICINLDWNNAVTVWGHPPVVNTYTCPPGGGVA